MRKQLALNVDLPLSHQFETFYPGPNEQICQMVKSWLRGSLSEYCFFLWGKSNCGKTHLLEACCHFAAQQNLRVIYLPIAVIQPLSVDILLGLEHVDVVAIDDVDLLLGNKEYEQKLLSLYEDFRSRNAYLLLSASGPPQNLSCHLADLRSRLSMAMIYQLQCLSDDEKIIALQRHAQYRGLKLSITVARYLVYHCDRNMNQLIYMLDRLAKVSLERKKKVSIPLIKSIWFSMSEA